jgi:hypothetical protein
MRRRVRPKQDDEGFNDLEIDPDTLTIENDYKTLLNVTELVISFITFSQRKLYQIYTT